MINNTDSFVAVIGAANMDLMGTMTGKAVEGDSNPGKVTVSSGGVARNIAENIARLGTRCELISAIGNDNWSKQLNEHCEAVGVGMSHCIVSAEHRTSSYLSMHDQQGELITAINDMSVLDCINPDTLANRLAVLSAADCWVLDANLSEETLAFLFSNAGSIPIWVDPVSTIKAQRLIPHLAKIHGLKPNLREAAMLTGLQLVDASDTPKLAATLHEKGVKQVMITLGEQGAYASNGQQTFWVDSKCSQVKNVTGCGDAAIAALVHGSVSGLGWQSSAELAMSAAALTASSIQTNSPLLSTLGINA